MFSADPGSKARWGEQGQQGKPDVNKNLEQACVGILSLGTMSVGVLVMAGYYHAVAGVTLLQSGLVALWIHCAAGILQSLFTGLLKITIVSLLC